MAVHCRQLTSMNDAAGTNYNTDYDHLMIKTKKMCGYSYT